MLGDIFTWLLDKVFGGAQRRRNRPNLQIESVDHGPSSMSTPAKVWVIIRLTITNEGRGTANSYNVAIGVTRENGVHLAFVDSRHPGDATMRQLTNEDVIEWQSTTPLPHGHSRTLEVRLHMQQGILVPIGVKLKPPGSKTRYREVVVTWHIGADPQVRLEKET